MYFTVYRVICYSLHDERKARPNYVEALVNAASKRSRNLLNAASRSAIPDFPATNGRISNNAASIPFYYYHPINMNKGTLIESCSSVSGSRDLRSSISAIKSC